MFLGFKGRGSCYDVWCIGDVILVEVGKLFEVVSCWDDRSCLGEVVLMVEDGSLGGNIFFGKGKVVCLKGCWGGDKLLFGENFLGSGEVGVVSFILIGGEDWVLLWNGKVYGLNGFGGMFCEWVIFVGGVVDCVNSIGCKFGELMFLVVGGIVDGINGFGDKIGVGILLGCCVVDGVKGFWDKVGGRIVLGGCVIDDVIVGFGVKCEEWIFILGDIVVGVIGFGIRNLLEGGMVDDINGFRGMVEELIFLAGCIVDGVNGFGGKIDDRILLGGYIFRGVVCFWDDGILLDGCIVGEEKCFWDENGIWICGEKGVAEGLSVFFGGVRCFVLYGIV